MVVLRTVLLSLIPTLLIIGGWGSIATVLAADVTVSATGLGDTRNAAMREMKRNAVEQAMGVLVKGSTLVEDFAVKRDRVLTLSDGFVKNISQLHEQRDNAGGWRLQAKVAVSSDSIKNEMMALKMLQIDAQMPRIAVLADERLNGEDKGFHLTEIEIISLLRAKQFNMIDPVQVRKLQSASFDQALFSGQNAPLQQLHARLDADFYVIAKTECDSAPIMAGVMMQTHQVVSTIKVLNAGTSALLAAETVTGRAAHISSQVGCAPWALRGKWALRGRTKIRY